MYLSTFCDELGHRSMPICYCPQTTCNSMIMAFFPGQEALNHVLPAIKAGLEDVERSIESGVPSHQLAADAGTLTQVSAVSSTVL